MARLKIAPIFVISRRLLIFEVFGGGGGGGGGALNKAGAPTRAKTYENLLLSIVSSESLPFYEQQI